MIYIVLFCFRRKMFSSKPTKLMAKMMLVEEILGSMQREVESKKGANISKEVGVQTDDIEDEEFLLAALEK